MLKSRMSIIISVAIPTMKRRLFLRELLPIYLDRPEVAEVVICDETGEDVDEILKSSYGNNPKLKLHKNEKRLGIYENKRKVLGLASSVWIALFDSDNIFGDEWFDCISSASLDSNTIYASADFKTVDIRNGIVNNPCKHFSGMTLDAGSWNSMFSKKGWNYLLNDGNWLLPKGVITTLPEETKSSTLLAADAIYMLRCFIKGGYSIHYLKNLEYTHLVHDGSSWIQEERQSSKILGNTDWRLI